MRISRTLRLILVLLLACSLAVVPAGSSSTVVGSAIGGSNATFGHQQLRPGGTVLSGDSLRVSEGTALVGMDDGSRLIFGENTIASFQKQSNGVTTVLDHGTVNLFHPGDGNSLVRLQVADVSVVPGSGFDSMGEIAMTGDTLVVVTREGLLRVEGGGRSVDVPKGKMITMHSYPARAPQIRTTTARPAFIHDLKYAAVAVAGAVGLALLINHIIEVNAKSQCEILNQFNPPSPVLPPQCR